MKHIHRILFVFAALLGLTVFASAQTAIATDTAKSSDKATTVTTPAFLAKTPTLLLTEDAVLPQGLVNIAIVSKDMSITDSLKSLNDTAGRNYMRTSDQTFEKNFIESHQQKIRESFGQVGSAVREHLMPIAVTRAPDKIASTSTSTAGSTSPSGGN